MTQVEEVGYPTRGELLHYLFKATGVMPEKRDLAPDFDEAQRRNLQKALERLAKEDGEVQGNFNEAVKQLSYLMAGYIPFVPLHLATGEVLDELLAVYSNTLIEEGTFLSKRETVRWLVADRWSSAAAVFVARQITRFGLRSVVELFPQELGWCLPSFLDEKPVWPLTKVMRWVYGKAGLTQTQFHYPGRQADESDFARKRDLENAQNWLIGGNLPSAAALRWTFDRAFETQALGCDPDPVAQRLHAEMAQMALFLARLATYVARDLDRLFGREFLLRACKTFEKTLKLALDETRHVDKFIEETAKERDMTAHDPELRADVIVSWNGSLKARLRSASVELQKMLSGNALREPDVQYLVARFGALAVEPQLEWLQAPAAHEVPQGFAEMVWEGERLAKDRCLTLAQVDSYEATSTKHGLSSMLPWMAPWLRFMVHYRQEEDAQAWESISRAFEAARYTAGARQYPIVNQYIEMAAKAGKNLRFRKGVEWARYTGVSVRWLNDQEPTAENLLFLMAMMQKARNAV